MEKLLTFLRTGMGTIVLVIVVILGIGSSIYFVRSWWKGDTPDDAHYTWFIDSETGRAFKHHNAIGDTIPLMSPYSRKANAYPAEACYWTADGGVKKDPTWVLLNESQGKPGPTFCPDCGRLVGGHNPKADPGRTPPPTQNEYKPTGGVRD